MNKYELGFIVSAKLNEEELTATIKKYTDIIESNKGTISSLVKSGVKKLAYAINYKKEGVYVTVEFQSEPVVPAEITRLFNIDENIYRYLFLNKN